VVRFCPRRSCCSGCGVTHVLLPSWGLWRRADTASVIGAAVVAKARGSGHRVIAAELGRPATTVRGWLRRFAAGAEQLRVVFTGLLHALDPQAAPLPPTRSGLADAVEALGRAAAAAALRLGPRPAWEFAAAASGGRLLAPGGPGTAVSNTN